MSKFINLNININILKLTLKYGNTFYNLQNYKTEKNNTEKDKW